jgi:hypothetical protein
MPASRAFGVHRADRLFHLRSVFRLPLGPSFIALAMLGLALANLAGLIIWIVVAARPAKSTESR